MKILRKIYSIIVAFSLAGYLVLLLLACLWWGGFEIDTLKSAFELLGINTNVSFFQLLTLSCVGAFIYFMRLKLISAFSVRQKMWTKSAWKSLFVVDLVMGATLIFLTRTIIDTSLIAIGWYVYYLYVFQHTEIWGE